MTDNTDDRSDAPDDERERDSSANWLSTLLSALERLEQLDQTDESISGRHRGDRTTVDYDISVDTGLDRSSDDAFGPRAGPDPDGAADRPRKRRRRQSTSASTPPSDDHHLTTHAYDDELLVTADVAGADPEEITVGFDDSTLVVAVSGRELDRVDVPWRDSTADAAIKNGVLTVEIKPDSESNDGRSETETGGEGPK